jgi:hypothetical protein
MSIRTEWRRLVQEERLYRLDPFPGDPRTRTVLMTPRIHHLAVAGPWDDEAMGDRCARLLATLQRIVRGAHLIVCLDPFAAREAELGRLDKIEDAVFDLRSREQPGLRVFCRFAERDVLVAFTCAPRSVEVSWLDKLPLGDRHSKDWKNAVRECIEQWTMFFPKHDPVLGDDLNAYLSNATLE